jgi:hypothetical protein
MDLPHSGCALPQGARQPARPPEAPEEVLVADDRAALTPAQLVEQKLVYLLKTHALPVSHVRTGARAPGRR